MRFLLFFTCLFFQACTTYSPSSSMTGLSQSEVIALMGKPDRITSTSGFTRLDFPRGPKGKHTYFLYFNDKNNLIRWEQVLNEHQFKKITVGMSNDEVIDIIGTSKERLTLGSGRPYTWSYRYETPICQWFQVEFNSLGFVKSTSFSRPPECMIRAVNLRGR